ncbi:hypothetical protein D2U88_02875 [Flagellimonas aequoris]|uniref:Uncharacterized protein n=1 Tax=Flagellimonas aequoris TaxID=2306997 RepID=A0A418NAF3_9FLAO|nr:hypothetical protein D2U88_02875 [Allomuricauda aequoris]
MYDSDFWILVTGDNGGDAVQPPQKSWMFYIARVPEKGSWSKGRWDEFVRLVTKNQIFKTKDPAIFSLVEFDFHRCKDRANGP